MLALLAVMAQKTQDCWQKFSTYKLAEEESVEAMHSRHISAIICEVLDDPQHFGNADFDIDTVLAHTGCKNAPGAAEHAVNEDGLGRDTNANTKKPGTKAKDKSKGKSCTSKTSVNQRSHLKTNDKHTIETNMRELAKELKGKSAKG